MNVPDRPAPRGRPRTITRERIADAGIALGLPNLTFVGVAAEMGVSHMALYKHVSGLDELKHLVAEEMFNRWEIPLPLDDSRDGLRNYLTAFCGSARAFVKANPGVTPYVIRRLAATPSMLAKIERHQRLVADVYRLKRDQARWLLATVAFHALAASDTVYAVAGKAPEREADRLAEEAEMDAELDEGMQVIIVGALAMLEQGLR